MPGSVHELSAHLDRQASKDMTDLYTQHLDETNVVWPHITSELEKVIYLHL